MNTTTPSATRLIRLPEVLHKTGYKKAWIYRLISENRFPKPIKLGSRAVAFIEAEIDQWISDAISNSRMAR
ncbi:AlpA family transcriptional regulator [Pantoea agglomerans]|uniref:helix-turn-helix transcriptional regulator n=1 Tax=Enterobacter agglomerans TaxID=549 RepID=UPI000534AC52|nr:AlpA family transcriptional regulator [Pantoea agglomerans]AZI51800.1 AlpA family transcriptional regulator [Pantoea agglomerans]